MQVSELLLARSLNKEATAELSHPHPWDSLLAFIGLATLPASALTA